MKHFFAPYIAFALLCFPLGALIAGPDTYVPVHRDVVIIAGQSNADGRGVVSELTENLSRYAGTQSNVEIHYTNTGYSNGDTRLYQTWTALRPGFSVPPGYKGSLPSPTFGIEVSAAQTLSTHYDYPTFIKVTRGGTALGVPGEDWYPAALTSPDCGPLFRALVTSTTQALDAIVARGDTYTLHALYWHQGESDHSRTAQYEVLLSTFIAGIRSELNRPDLPFIIGELAHSKPQSFRDVQQQVATIVPNTSFLSSEGLTTSDGTHFTTASLIEFGARLGSSLIPDPPVGAPHLMVPLTNSTYTIDTQTDFDTYKAASFSPGDLILFRRGRVFSGSFAPTGSGTAGQPIRIATYGEGEMPIINALGTNKAAIHLKNVEYWEVHNLELTNTDGSQDHQGKIMGIYVETDDSRPHAVMNHIHIKGCYVHDVNGRTLDSDSDGAKRHGGIHVHTYGTTDTRIHDLQIVGNTVERTGGVGIGIDSNFNAVQNNDIDQLWTNVHIAENFINDTDRNNMIVRDSLNPLVEHNILANSSRENTGHNLFNFHTVGFVAQYNEAYGNVGEGDGGDEKDRGGFDADYNSRDTVFQYNYSHDNLWFIGIMKRWNKTVDIRYNISQNDRDGFCFFGFDSRSDCEDVRVYNNIYYTGEHVKHAQFVAENRRPHNTQFFNNIFFNAKGNGFFGTGVDAGIATTSFSNNVYFGFPARAEDPSPISTDPMLEAPGTGGYHIDMKDPDRLLGYRLKAGSPCMDAGLSVAGITRDFWGNAVPAGSGTDIGVHEVQPNP